jgi:hypothetical protein
MSIAELSAIEAPVNDDDLHLAACESKLQLVRDYAKGVALGFSNGFFLYGTGGIAKSYTVLGELQRLAVNFKLFNSRMSGRGLFDALGEYPKAVHVLEDMERVVKGKDAQGIIRSACWAQRGDDGRQKRTITWAMARGIESIIFQGGLIMLSNRALDDLPELRAIRTRIKQLELGVLVTLQADMNEPHTEADINKAAVQAIANAVRLGEDNGFSHDLADDVSFGLVAVDSRPPKRQK